MNRRNRRRLMWGVSGLTTVVAVTALILFVACTPKPTVPDVDDQPPQGPVVPAGPDYYEDVTDATGIQFAYRNGEEARHMSILESLGGGGTLVDLNGDGLLDLFVAGGGYYKGANGPDYWKARDEWKKDQTRPFPDGPKILGHPGKFYLNKGNFKFEDVTDQVGLDRQPDYYTHGAAVADYDRDGWQDLLITGYGRVVLYHNEPDGKGGRKFVDVTAKAGLLGSDPKVVGKEAGQAGPHFWSTSAAWADLDADGFPELYLCQYVNWSFVDKDTHPFCQGYKTDVKQDVCPPKQYEMRPHALWKNAGNGTFVNVTREAGIRVEPREDKDYGKGLGVLIVDLNGDGKPDIYVCNDTTDNFLYLNASTPGQLKFEDKGLAMGVARDHNGVPNGSMGVHCADYDGCGRPAVWVTNYENEYHALYKSLLIGGRLSFTFNTPAAGLSVIGPNYVGFGTMFADVDSDGWEDLVISNGHVVHFPPRDNKKQRPILFVNMEHQTPAGPARRFADGTIRGGSYFKTDHRGRGLALGDLDNDGRPDLVFIGVNEPVRVLKNVGKENHWLGVQLKAKDRADVVGARLTLEVGDRQLVRFGYGGGSYLSGHDARKLFGLGAATKVGKLRVEWPSGEPRVQEFNDLAVDKYHVLEQK